MEERGFVADTLALGNDFLVELLELFLELTCGPSWIEDDMFLSDLAFVDERDIPVRFARQQIRHGGAMKLTGKSTDDGLRGIEMQTRRFWLRLGSYQSGERLEDEGGKVVKRFYFIINVADMSSD